MTNADMLSPAEKEAADKLIAKVRAAGAKQKAELVAKDKLSLAKWKMQIRFRSDRSRRETMAFTLSIWESGRRLHGGGDESAFFCRAQPGAPAPSPPLAGGTFARLPERSGCNSVIPGDNVVYGGKLYCPSCGVTWGNTTHVADSLYYRLTVDKASEVLADWFRKLESNADISAKYLPTDVRSIAMAKSHGVETARRLRGLAIYPLKNIIKDTAAGATLESRIKAFLLA